MKTLHAIFLSLALLTLGAGGATAQANVAVISQEGALLQSKVGKSVAEQLLAIDKQIDVEFEPELAPLRTQAQQLNAEISALTPEVLRTRTDLMRREQELRQKLGELADWKKRQMNATGEEARKPILQAYEAAVNAVITEKKIDILLNESAVLFRNKQSDITADVIKKMDEAVSTSVVVRVRVPRKPEPQQPGARQGR